MVDVIVNQVSVADFTLQKTSPGPASGAEAGSDGLGSDKNTVYGTEGSTLDLYRHENIRGNISIMPVEVLEGPVKGGGEQTFSLPLLATTGDITCIRLYVFSSAGYDITRAAGADPSFIVVQGTTSINPDRVYRDHGLNATSGLVTTSCFILPNSTKPGQTIKLIMDNSPGTSCILEGAALVVVSRNENGPNIWYWLHEGADVISAPPGRENNDAETTAEFYLEPSGSAFSHADLQFISTSMVYDTQSRYLAAINGETFPGTFTDPKSPVRTAAISFPAPQAGSQVHTSIQAILNESSVLYGETRIAIFTMNGQVKKPVPAQTSVNTTVPGKSENVSSSQGKTNPGISTTPVRNTPGPVPVKKIPGPTSKEFSSWGFDTLDRVFVFLFSLVGDMVPLDRNSVNDVIIEDAHSDNSTESIPHADPLRGEFPTGDDPFPVENSALITPVPVTGYPTESPVIAVKKEPNVVNNPGTTLQRKPASHSGGIYITSYPADAELRVDTKKIEAVLPAVVYGLKEGIHIVEVRQTSEMDKTTVSRSLRVWVYADAVTTADFNLISGNIPRKIRINSPDNTSYSFTVNGYYPIRKTPAEIECTGPDDFFTVIREGAYLSYRPFAITSDENSIAVPVSSPPLYKLPVESSPPGGEIFVDGLWSGYTTPAVIPNLSTGLHRIIVTLPGYIPGETITEIPITDSPVVRKPVSFILDTYASGPVTLESIPPAADILIDGIVTGEITPYTFEHLSLGIHQVTVRRNGESRTIEVNVKPGESHREVVMFKEKGSVA